MKNPLPSVHCYAEIGKPDLSSITLAPGWKAALYGNGTDPSDMIEIVTPGCAPDAEGVRVLGDFPGGGCVYLNGPATPDNVADNLIALLGVCNLHEGFEWIKVDGKIQAEAHPQPQEAEDEMWTELMSDMLSIVRKYKTKYPRRES